MPFSYGLHFLFHKISQTLFHCPCHSSLHSILLSTSFSCPHYSTVHSIPPYTPFSYPHNSPIHTIPLSMPLFCGLYSPNHTILLSVLLHCPYRSPSIHNSPLSMPLPVNSIPLSTKFAFSHYSSVDAILHCTCCSTVQLQFHHPHHSPFFICKPFWGSSVV